MRFLVGTTCVPRERIWAPVLVALVGVGSLARRAEGEGELADGEEELGGTGGNAAGRTGGLWVW
jgi:hypothetical protein